MNEAFENEDFQAASLYQRKLQQLGADTSMADYRTAEKLFAEGQLDEALSRMQAIAQGQNRGAASAAYWIVQQLLQNKIELAEDQRLQVIGDHLDQLEELVGRRDTSIKYLRAVWLIQKQELEPAADLLKEIVAEQPGAAFQRLWVNLQLQRMDEARADARMVRRYYTDQQRRSAALTQLDYSQWAGVEELLGDTSRLTEVLDAWKSQFPDDPAVEKAIAGSYIRQLQNLLNQPRQNPVALADAIVGTAIHSPESTPDLERIVNELVPQRNRSQVARNVLAELTRREDLPAALWRMLGTAACMQGDFDEGRLWLSKAIRLDDTDAVAKNNFAWLLSNAEPLELEEALKLVNESLTLMPEEYRFRETRGQILVQLQRWEEAIEDLEFALNGMPDADDIHKSLAEAYLATGQPELAEFHQEQP